MDEAVAEWLVTCRRCCFRFGVEAVAGDGWRVEAQCPSCEVWACFTAADTQALLRPDPAELDAEAQRLGELLWQPVKEHRGHPAVVWLDRVGNGVFEDDQSRGCWPVPHWVCRFTCGGSAAYIWQEAGAWFVRGWHPLGSRGSPPDPAVVILFEGALDRLEG